MGLITRSYNTRHWSLLNVFKTLFYDTYLGQNTTSPRLCYWTYDQSEFVVLFDNQELNWIRQIPEKTNQISSVTELWLTFPHPGTSTPSIGRGISILRTTPYLLHSSLMSSRISSYSSSSLSSSGVTMFNKHKTSVAGPDAPTILKPGTWICTAGKTVVFFAPTLALCTIKRLSPSCIPFKPAMA